MSTSVSKHILPSPLSTLNYLVSVFGRLSFSCMCLFTYWCFWKSLQDISQKRKEVEFSVEEEIARKGESLGDGSSKKNFCALYKENSLGGKEIASYTI